MKFILKKDLPFAKAGSIVYNFEGQSDFEAWDEIYVKCDNSDSYKTAFLYYANKMVYVGQKEHLLKEGWIEEVKPREWHISESNLEYFDKLYKEEYHLEVKYLKVREVL